MDIKKKLLALGMAVLTCAGCAGIMAYVKPSTEIDTKAMEIDDSFNLDDDSEGTIIFQADISKAIITITDGNSYVHTGKEICPKITVRRSPTAIRDLVEGTQYTVKYLNNVQPGTATIEVTGVGQFKGTARTTFNITHDYSIEKVVKPTYKEEGYTLHECSVCGENYKDNYVDKLLMTIKYQLKEIDEYTCGVRALLIVNEDYVQEINSASAYLALPDDGNTDNAIITKAYRSVIANGKTVTAGDGKVFLLAKFLNIPNEAVNGLTAHFDCDGIITERTL